MKRLMFIAFLLSLGSIAGVAERISVPIKTTSKKSDNPIYHRTPAKLPIEVVYDTDTSLIEVFCPTHVEAEVEVYNSEGEVEAYSPVLNSILSVSCPGSYTIVITGDDWIATGVIE